MTYQEAYKEYWSGDNDRRKAVEARMSAAELAAFAIANDVSDRRGMGWDDIGDDIKDEVFAAWVGLIERPSP